MVEFHRHRAATFGHIVHHLVVRPLELPQCGIMIPMKKRGIIIRTRFGAHTCLFYRDEKGYVVTAKDIPGVVTWGRNLAHAKEMAKEALELMIETIAIESPTSLAVT